MFKIDEYELKKMEIMPEAIIVRYSNISNVNRKVGIFYPFKFAPSGWMSWQAIGAFKYQISQIFKTAVFETLEDMKGEWTVGSMGRFFNDYIEFPKPYYPQFKSEFNSRLAIYATRLHFNSKLFYESLFAMAINFNTKLGNPYSMRELSRKTSSILKLDRSEWKVKLSDEDRKVSMNKTHSANKLKGDNKLQELIDILPYNLKKNGKPDICPLMEKLNIGRSRVYALLKKIV